MTLSVTCRKVVKRRMAQSDADGDLQATAYLAARRAEDNPAREFRFHTAIKNRTPTAEVVSTSRTDAQLDGLLDRPSSRCGRGRMAWRVEMDVWDGATARRLVVRDGSGGYLAAQAARSESAA